MGYTAYGHGDITMPAGVKPDDLYISIGWDEPDNLPADPQKAWERALYDTCEMDGDDISAHIGEDGTVTISVSYNGNMGGRPEAALDNLAQAGGTGEVEFTGEDDARWLVALHDGTTTEHGAEVFYPTLPGDDSPVLLLSRRDVKACIAFLCGQPSDDQQALLERLTAALNA